MSFESRLNAARQAVQRALITGDEVLALASRAQTLTISQTLTTFDADNQRVCIYREYTGTRKHQPTYQYRVVSAYTTQITDSLFELQCIMTQHQPDPDYWYISHAF
jgi:hypothetical protein